MMVATDAVFENDSLKFVYLGKEKPVKTDCLVRRRE